MASHRPLRAPARTRDSTLSLLMKAAAEGDLATTVSLATKRRALSVNTRGQTPLMLASIGGWEHCVKALISLSDTRQVDELGRSALSLAAKYGRARCVRALLPLSDPNTEDMDGRNALMSAAAAGSAECVDLLLSETMLSARDGDHETAFELAAGSGNVACLRLFLAALPQLDPVIALHAAHSVVSSGSVDGLLTIEGPLRASFSASPQSAARAVSVWRELAKSAARMGQIDMLDALLPRYARAIREHNAEEPRGERDEGSPFDMVEAAARSGNAECVKFLLNQPGYEASARGALAEAVDNQIGKREATLIRWALAEIERDSISSSLRGELQARSRPCQL